MDRAASTDSRQRRALGIFAATGGVHYHVDDEVPAGVVDGANDTFTLAQVPVPSSVLLFRNGILMRRGSTNDYTLEGQTITFTPDARPDADADLAVWYRLLLS